MWRRERCLALMLFCAGSFAHQAKAEILGSAVQAPVGFGIATNQASGEILHANFNRFNGIDDQISAGWLQPGNFDSVPVDFSANFTAGTQYWTKVGNSGAIRENGSDRFKKLDNAIANVYSRFSKGTLGNYEFGGSGSQASPRDLQLAIWNLQDKGKAQGSTERDQRPGDWMSDDALSSAAGTDSPIPLESGTFGGNDSSTSFGGSATGSAGGSASGGGGSSGGDAGGGGGSSSGGSSSGSSTSRKAAVVTASSTSATDPTNAASLTNSSSPSAASPAIAPLPTTAWGGLALLAVLAGIKGLGASRCRHSVKQ